MRNKKNTKFLLLGVILIYSAIVARFFLFQSGQNGENRSSIDRPSFQTKIAFEAKKSFQIKNNHRDPFLKTVRKKKPSRASTAVSKPAPEEPIMDTSPAMNNEHMEDPFAHVSSLEYKGLVSATDKATKVFALSINGKEYLVKLGQSLDDKGIRILSGNKKELTILFQGEQETLDLVN